MQWVAKAELIAYGPLGLKPWEFERLTVREFDLLCKGYEMRARDRDMRLAYFFTMATNVHIAKESQRISVRDVMKQLHPASKVERLREEIEFEKEWQQALEEGGKADGRYGDTGQD